MTVKCIHVKDTLSIFVSIEFPPDTLFPNSPTPTIEIITNGSTKIQAFHTPNSNAGMRDRVLPLKVHFRLSSLRVPSKKFSLGTFSMYRL